PVSKDEGRTLVTTVLNANDAASVGGNPVTLSMPEGFAVDSASQADGASNDGKSATQGVPATPLPAEVPCSGAGGAAAAAGGPAAAAESSGETAGASSLSSPSEGAGDGELRIELGGSSVTVFVMSEE